jgi:hypothetical protein
MNIKSMQTSDQRHRIGRISLIATGSAMLFFSLLYGIINIGKQETTTPQVTPIDRTARHRQDIGRGFKIRSGDPESPVLYIETAQLIKRKAGPFVLSAFNTLVVDGFKIVFSPQDTESFALPAELKPLLSLESAGASTSREKNAQPFFPLRSRENLMNYLGADKKISGVTIHSFSLAVMAGETEVSILKAEQAEGNADGTLHLKNCTFVDTQKETRFAAKANLRLADPAVLSANGQQIPIRDVIRAYAGSVQF